ncbi:phosphoribosylanthranilate isomerase [Candidatus Pelagibacter communis]|uniref:phosphoribosylanthranilate isomerase n=1 Tax=Pelagibacter ubique TaxID=198252 RepID=UPI00094CF8BF|nr:phosphoribosylanthranilate isomerase [Candidatus Pelagibacter ubique]
MTLECKICGVSEDKILNFIINHKFPPKFIGFIVNYPKSKRFVEIDKLKNLINIDKKESKFVAVLVKPTDEILKKIQYLKFDYYQIYDCTPEEINQIKKKYNKKIISAITIENKSDLKNYKDFLPFSDIILFDSKGYEKSLGFDHNLLNGMPNNFKKMVAGNLKINDILKFKSKEYIIDVSGALEDSTGKKSLKKIDQFLIEVNKV